MVDFADIERAAALLAGEVIRTPTLPAPRLSALTGAEVFVKYENMQVTGSFKERGAANRMRQLTRDEGSRGVVAMSAGNHAQAVAWHARKAGVPATIVMPLGTPHVKAENTRALGADVVLSGETLAEAEITALELVEGRGLTLVHPYDDPFVIAGQGTAAVEMLADAPELDAIVVPIGGGGLMSGMAIAATALKPGIEIIGAEAALYPSFRNAIRGEARAIGGPTLAEGIAVKNVGALTLAIVRALVSDIILVDEDRLEKAVALFAALQRTMAEGAGAAGLAAMLTEPDRFQGRRVGLILCGGNIDARLLAGVMVRELERAERIVSFRVTTLDRPGLLGQLASRVGALGGNILEVNHQRLLLNVPAKGVSIDLTVEMRDAADTAAMLAALAAEGWSPARLDENGEAGLG
jgi:threonine dehydratase